MRHYTKNETKYAVTFGDKNGSLNSEFFSNKKEAREMAKGIKNDWREVYIEEEYQSRQYMEIERIK